MENDPMTSAGATANRLSQDQEKIVSALAGDDYYWRTRERMLAVTGMPPEHLDTALTQLLQQDVVQTTFSKNHNVVFGLRQRVQEK